MIKLKKVDNFEKYLKLEEKYSYVNDIKFLNELDKLIENEKKILERGNFFEEDMGDFWLAFETRTYMRLLYAKMDYFAETGRIKKAIKLCEYMLELCEGDNLGVRFNLMSYYALLEDEKIIELYKKFNFSLFEKLPMAIYCFKIGDDINSKKIMKEIKKDYPNIKEDLQEISVVISHYPRPNMYSRGSFEEVVVAANINYYLLMVGEYFVTQIDKM
ncbi:hypothetical protein [Oceanivirga salmonicida]|uniref:hypothetical protein n=1 Tax=Oceanivirga salmonicida TaxID=1769291 RepID=UPI0012E20546|nr:hypothetical protein [Oceanivirga salmonicida]